MKTTELLKAGWTRSFGTIGYPTGRRAWRVLLLSMIFMAVAVGLSFGFEDGGTMPFWATLTAGICLGLGGILFFAGMFMATEGRAEWLSEGGPCVGCGQAVMSTDVGTLAEAKRIRDLMKEHRAKLRRARRARRARRDWLRV